MKSASFPELFLSKRDWGVRVSPAEDNFTILGGDDSAVYRKLVEQP